MTHRRALALFFGCCALLTVPYLAIRARDLVKTMEQEVDAASRGWRFD